MLRRATTIHNSTQVGMGEDAGSMLMYLEDPCSVVVDQGRLAVHHSTRSTHNAATIHLANALVAHAHAKDREIGSQGAHYLQGYA